MSCTSTEQMLNSFPMFGHTGWSALEYARAYDQMGSNTSTTSASLRRTSTDSTQDDNTTPPTTAGTQPTGYEASFPMLCNSSSPRKRAKGTFLNHTPRDHEVWHPRPVDTDLPRQTSRENYSRPMLSDRAIPVEEDGVSTSQHGKGASMEPCTANDYQVSVYPVAPIELESMKTPSSYYSTEEFPPSDKPLQRSTSVPVARALKCEPRAVVSLGCDRDGLSIWNEKSRIKVFQSLKVEYREEPSKALPPNPKKAARHVLLEPLVAKHRSKASHEALRTGLPQMESDQAGDVGVFGATEEYMDIQAGEAFSTSEKTFRAHLPDPREMSFLESSEPTGFRFAEKRVTRWPVPELEIREPRPPVPKRSSERLANARFLRHAKSCSSADVDHVSETQNQYAPHQRSFTHDYSMQGSGTQAHRRIELGRAGRSGSTQVGRLAPPILSHAALTASSNLCLNDLSFYLKNTGPPSPVARPATHHLRKKSLNKLFRGKDRKKRTAPEAQSASASLRRIQKQASVIPSCTREMKTTGGIRHLRIIVPTVENEYEMQAGPIGAWQCDAERHRKREAVVSEVTYHGEMTEATYPHTLVGGPVYAPDEVRDTMINGVYGAGNEEGFEEEDPACTMERLKERMVLLQRQNTRLMEELVKILGLEMDHDDLECEDVLRASARARLAKSRVAG